MITHHGKSGPKQRKFPIKKRFDAYLLLNLPGFFIKVVVLKLLPSKFFEKKVGVRDSNRQPVTDRAPSEILKIKKCFTKRFLLSNLEILMRFSPGVHF